MRILEACIAVLLVLYVALIVPASIAHEDVEDVPSPHKFSHWGERFNELAERCVADGNHYGAKACRQLASRLETLERATKDGTIPFGWWSGNAVLWRGAVASILDEPDD